MVIETDCVVFQNFTLKVGFAKDFFASGCCLKRFKHERLPCLLVECLKTRCALGRAIKIVHHIKFV